VSGIAGLLLSLQLMLGQEPNPKAVRVAILESAYACDPQATPDCRPFMVGRLNIVGAHRLIAKRPKKATVDKHTTEPRVDAMEIERQGIEGASTSIKEGVVTQSITFGNTISPKKGEQGKMDEQQTDDTVADQVSKTILADQHEATNGQLPEPMQTIGPGQIQPAQNGSGPSLVYALGTLGYNLVSEARRDSIMQHMDGNPNDPKQLLAYLDNNPSDAAAIIWTLNLDATPVYAIRPQGAFAREGYERLRQFLLEQIEEGVERISVPGIITGQAQLMSGQVVPVIQPDLRGMYSWTTAALVEAVCGERPPESAKATDREAYAEKVEAVSNFLERVYHELRNLGLTAQERAINYAATNAMNVEKIFEAAIKDEMELDTIEIEPSSICRPGSDCWDVKLTFFNPGKVFEQARKVYSFTVDGSEVCPVMMGKVRSWSIR
jgi:cyanobactin maturation PatA/PatG family protease